VRERHPSIQSEAKRARHTLGSACSGCVAGPARDRDNGYVCMACGSTCSGLTQPMTGRRALCVENPKVGQPMLRADPAESRGTGYVRNQRVGQRMLIADPAKSRGTGHARITQVGQQVVQVVWMPGHEKGRKQSEGCGPGNHNCSLPESAPHWTYQLLARNT